MKTVFQFFSFKQLCCAILLTSSTILVHAQDVPADIKFKLSITYGITVGDKGNQKMGMWFSDDNYIGVDGGSSKEVFIVYNIKAMKMLTIMEAQKMIMVMDISKYQQQAASSQAAGAAAGSKESSNTKITKTGVTEKILGYNCTQYKVTSDKSEALIWITTDLGPGFGDLSKSLGMILYKGNQGSLPDTQGAENGVMLKMEITDLSSKKITKLEATEVSKDGKEINTAGYSIMKMPGQ